MSQLNLFRKEPETRYWIEKLVPMLAEKKYNGTAKHAWKILRKTEFPRLFMRMYLSQKEWIHNELEKS